MAYEEDERLENVRYDCYQYVRNMELHHIVCDEHFKDLEKECMKTVLIKKADRLERFLAGSEHICKRIAQCIICRKMVSLMISQSENPEVGATVRRHCYGGNYHFDKNLIHTMIIQDFNDLLNLDYD